MQKGALTSSALYDLSHKHGSRTLIIRSHVEYLKPNRNIIVLV